MRIEDIKVGMRVRHDTRRGGVVEIKPNSKHLVVVLFDGADTPTPYPVSVLRKLALLPVERDLADGYVRYPMDPERALRPWKFVEWTTELAWIVGYAAQTNASLLHSGQPNAGRSVEDEFAFGPNSNGEKFDVILPNPNFAGLDEVLDINFIHRGGLRMVNLNKEGFWRFLEGLGFETGRDKDQNVHIIRQSIPQENLADFDAGVRGSVPKIA